MSGSSASHHCRHGPLARPSPLPLGACRLVHFGYHQFNNSLVGMQGKMEACLKPSRDVVVTPNIPNALAVVKK